jgi:hypothetical protein
MTDMTGMVFIWISILPVLARDSPILSLMSLGVDPPLISQGLARPPFSHQDYLRSDLSDVDPGGPLWPLFVKCDNYMVNIGEYM